MAALPSLNRAPSTRLSASPRSSATPASPCGETGVEWAPITCSSPAAVWPIRLPSPPTATPKRQAVHPPARGRVHGLPLVTVPPHQPSLLGVRGASAPILLRMEPPLSALRAGA